jgi:hypothetical protein
MPIPQVNDRIKEAPVVVLRAVFAGIGQLLLTADKVRARAAEQVWIPDRPAGPGPACSSPSRPAATTKTAPATKATVTTEPAAPAKPASTAKASATTKPAVQARPAPTAKATAPAQPAPAAKATAPAQPAPAAKAHAPAKPAPTAQAVPATKPVSPAKPSSGIKAAPAAKPTPAAKAAPAPEAPPLPGYDDLSLPSLRARLRSLDAPAIRAMLAYEQAHARRDDVITMLERRLAKISAE